MPFPTLTAPPTAPDRTSGSFSTQADAFVAWWATSVSENTAWAAYANSLSLVTGSYQFADGAVATPAMTFAADTDTGIYRPGNNTLGFVTAGTENFRVNPGGTVRLCAQGNGVASFPTGLTGALQIQGISGIANLAQHRASADSSGPALNFSKSRGTTAGDSTIVVNGDILGQINAYGGDGAQQQQAAYIRAITEGTPALGDVRAGWRFYTGNGAGSTAIALTLDTNQAVLAMGTGGLGYGQGGGAGSSVTQLTSRTTGVTINTPTGRITMFTAAGSTTAATFTVTNSQVGATDTVVLAQRSGTNKYNLLVTAVAAGSFDVTFYTTGGTASDTPTIAFALIKGSIT